MIATNRKISKGETVATVAALIALAVGFVLLQYFPNS